MSTRALSTKLFVGVLALALGLGLVGCGNNRMNRNKPTGTTGNMANGSAVGQGSSASVQQLLQQWSFLQVSGTITGSDGSRLSYQIQNQAWLTSDNRGQTYYEVWPMISVRGSSGGGVVAPMGYLGPSGSGYAFETSQFNASLLGLGSGQVVIDLELSFNSNQFNPNASQVFILGCAGSGENCNGSPINGVTFQLQ